MRKLQLLMGTIFIALVGLFGLAQLVGAYDIHTGDNVTTKQGQQIHDSVYMAGRTVDINSEIFGDVYCAGQNITVSGTVHGDVLCAGQTLNVSGKIDGDVRLAGQTVTLSAVVSGNATIGGQSFVLDSSGSVGGDITLGSSDSTINGQIGRDIIVGGSTVIINNIVGRNIKAAAESMKLSAGARVGGTIELTSHNNISRDQQAVVLGKIIRTEPNASQAKSKHGALFGFGFAWFLYWFAAMLFTALILALLFPRMFQSVTDQALPRPWKALLVGFVGCIVVPIVLVVSAVSVIGLPLAFIGGLAWLVALLLSGPLFGYYIGRLVMPDSKKVLLIMITGAGLLTILYFIPFIGALAILAATFTGTGMLLLEAFRRTPRPSYTTVTASKKK